MDRIVCYDTMIAYLYNVTINIGITYDWKSMF